MASQIRQYLAGSNGSLGRDKQSAIDYAKGRAKFGRGEIRVLRPDGSLKRVTDYNQTNR